MKEEFKREDLIFCIGLIRDGFLMVGYKEEKDRIQAIAKGLLKSWKRKWARWDKNDLENHFLKYVENGLGKLILPEIVSFLKETYKLTTPPKKEVPIVDRKKLEKDHLKEIIRRIEEEDYFSEVTYWRELNLFHIPMELSREFIPQEYFEEFGKLKEELKNGDLGTSINTFLRKRFGSIEGRRKPKEEAELLKVVNRVTEKLIIHKAYVVGVLTATLT